MTVFHEGEIAVQEKAGVRLMANRVGRVIHPFIFDAAAEFLSIVSVIFTASNDVQGRLWASVMTGEIGFVRALDASTLLIAAQPHKDDPLDDNLQLGDAVGILAIDFAAQMRYRFNGSLSGRSDAGLTIATTEVYVNCPKYIQERDITATRPAARADVVALTAKQNALSAAQQAWIAQSDTFIIASAHPDGGADASHRGGNPGFIQVPDERRIIFPDYSGNMMFNTLGNIAVNPSVGLLFPDFALDRVLQLTGRASIIWDQSLAESFPGAQRLVSVEIDEVIERQAALGLQFGTPQYSRFNPSLAGD